MIHALIVGCGLLAATPPDLDAAETDLKAYQEAKTEAKRDPDANVRLALWCEARGLDAQRLKHLAIAVLADPKHATARGLLGLVAYHGQWQRPESVAEHIQTDTKLAAALADYNARRARTANTADAQWQLALWCEQKGLKAEASAHLSAVVRLDPTRDEAWKRLGYKKHHGRWMTEEQIVAQKTEAQAQRNANRRWKTLLEKWKGWQIQKHKRAEAEAALAGVDDPRAVPAIYGVFGAGRASDQARAVQLLGQIDAPAASRALAFLAVNGSSTEVRRAAAETLRRRDAREFADLLIGLIRSSIKYEVRHVGGPGSPGELIVEGKQFNVKRLYAPPSLSNFELQPGDTLEFDARGLPVIARHRLFDAYVGTPINQDWAGFSAALPRSMMASMLTYGSLLGTSLGASVNPLAAQFAYSQGPQFFESFSNSWSAGFGLPYSGYGSGFLAPSQPAPETVIRISRGPAGMLNNQLVFRHDERIPIGQMMTDGGRLITAVAEQQLQNDIKILDGYNKSISPLNNQVAAILTDVTGQDLGTDREAWKKWWVDQIGYAYFGKRYAETPTFVENVAIQTPTYTQDTPIRSYQRISCFGAGTPVHTLGGTRAIETLKVGDQVLSQNTTTGALSYQPILVVHHNPPSKTFRIKLGDETVVSSPFHRFWRAGRGWVMARDLKEGNSIRTLAGALKLTEVSEGDVQPVYNLDVAETGSFFVGQGGVLVHDNTLPAPVLQPFDAEPVLAQHVN